MSSHYGNSLTVVSPNQQYYSYEVPKFETGKRRSSFTQSPQSSSYMHIKAVQVSPIPPRNKRSSVPSTPPPFLPLHVTPNQRSRSFTSPNIITPKTLDAFSLHSNEESKTSPYANGRHSVIGLPSEYPASTIHNRDGSVVSSFASSVASSLLMDEIEDFEQFFGDDLYGTKVYDDLSCSTHHSPLKSDTHKPTHMRARAISDTTMESVKDVTSPLLNRPMVKPSKRDSVTSIGSKESLCSKSSRSRRRRNFGLSENDFQKITNDFSSLIMQ